VLFPPTPLALGPLVTTARSMITIGMLGANRSGGDHGHDHNHRRHVGLDIRGASGARGPRCTRELVAVPTRCDCPQDSAITGNVIPAHSLRRTDFARVADREADHCRCAGSASAAEPPHGVAWPTGNARDLSVPSTTPTAASTTPTTANDPAHTGKTAVCANCGSFVERGCARTPASAAAPGTPR
jgi:hypothetical protein